jgi:PAS domain S-box-containing protein
MDAIAHDLFSGVDANFLEIFRDNPSPMWVYDLQSLRLLHANQAALATYGYSREAFLRLNLIDLHAQEDLPRLQLHLKLPLIERVAQRAWRHRHCSGELMEVEIATQELSRGGVQARIVMVTDLSARRRLEAQQRELTQRLMTQERTLVRRLAQTLHDHLGQTMAAIRMAQEQSAYAMTNLSKTEARVAHFLCIQSERFAAMGY